MATIFDSTGHSQARGDDRFFLTSAFVFAAIIVAGFSLQLAAGRSTFGAPPLVHAHAVVFMGWVVIYVLQSWFATRGPIALHRRLGWLAVGWVVAMVVLGIAVTLAMVRRGQTPFIFRPAQFLIFDPISLLTFAGFVAAAVSLRRQTDWHRRINFCGMALLLGPAFGRLLPMPLLMPWAWEATVVAVLIMPGIGAFADLRRTGRVHPAFVWGIATIIGSAALTEVLTYSPAGTAIYQHVTAGTPGAAVPPLEFAPPPAGPLITGRHGPM